MADTLGTFYQGILDGTVQTIYTVPASHTLVPKTISVTNLTTNMPNIKIWFVASGENEGDKNLEQNCRVIEPHDTMYFNTDKYLQAGYIIKAQISIPNSCNLQLSGVDMSAS